MTDESEKLKRPQYKDKFTLMNKSEHLLFTRLVEAAPAMLVFSQVSMSQLFHINSKRGNGFLQVAEIGRKSIDFLICRSDTSIVLAIELNGPTHEREAQKARDEKKRIALEEAGIPLIVLDPACIPEVIELRRKIAPMILERKQAETERNERVQNALAKKSEAAKPQPKSDTAPTEVEAVKEEPAKKKFWFKRKPKS